MRLLPSLFIVAVASQVGATDCGQVIRDSSFDLWCGDELCAWKVTRGEIKRVPTWNEGDSGVELVGSDTAIQQITPVNSGDGTCIQFEMIANVETNAEVFLDIDVEGDGTVERSERVPAASWKPLSYNISIAAPFDGIRFEITKAGAGKAQLANIGAKTVDKRECDGLTSLDPGPRRDGAVCDPMQPNQCTSGICGESPSPRPAAPWFTATCLGCNPAQPSCGTGEVCGLGDPFSPVFAIPAECVAAASKELGELCISDGECGTGVCRYTEASALGVCSTCRSDADCEPGVSCASSWLSGGEVWTGPYVCGASQAKVPSGGACGQDDDCVSGHCNGTVRSVCSDGRTCSSPSQCPFGVDGADPLQNGSCDTVGVQGGTCQ